MALKLNTEITIFKTSQCTGNCIAKWDLLIGKIMSAWIPYLETKTYISNSREETGQFPIR